MARQERSNQLWRGALATVALTVLLADAAPVDAWSARKSAPVKTKRAGGGSTVRTATTQPGPSRPATAPLSDRVAAAVTRKSLSEREILNLLSEVTAVREPALLGQLVGAIEQAPRVTAQTLLQAAQQLGADHPAGKRLWRRAWQQAQEGGQHPAVVRQIAEGYVDVLLAAGDAEEALTIVRQVLTKAGAGQRRGLYERLAAIARLQGRVEEQAIELAGLTDPDALTVASQLQVESGDDEAAVATLQRAWQRQPGNRTVQAAYTQLLQRLGRREELRTLLEQVVRMAPADPMPLLAVVDAHIAARDNPAAYKQIDELVRRYPRNDVLLEALIDRAQRLGATDAQVIALYQQLLTVAPRQPHYIEAFAEWLLGRGKLTEAMEVSARLQTLPGARIDGLLRQAQLLYGHKLVKPTRAVVDKLLALAPTDPRVQRLHAQVSDLEGQSPVAEAQWLTLAQLDNAPTPTDRRRAADARQALVALYRRLDVSEARRKLLRQRIDAGEAKLGQTLLFLDLQAQLDPPKDTAGWLALATALRQRHGPDPELLTALASSLTASDQTEAALPLLTELRQLDPDAAEPLLQAQLDAALARGRRELALRLEAVLAPPPPAQVAVTALLRLGDVHLRYGDPAGAAALFRRAAQSAGRDTRPTARLAVLFRQTGQDAEEESALRDILQRATDPDELELAGQRLVTVALGHGRSADLVRWLDALMPQHPRRDVLARFRSAAYDVWLRTAPLDAALGLTVQPPAAGSLADALGSSDLALQIRALRQTALAHRTLPATVARALLVHANPALRRDAALALGASGSAEAAQLLCDVMAEGLDRDEEVLAAQVLALAQLPPPHGIDPVLVSAMARNDSQLPTLALGIVGGGDGIGELLRQLTASRPQAMFTGEWLPALTKGPVPALLALAQLVARMPTEPRVDAARQQILDTVQRLAVRTQDNARSIAALWALRVIGHPRTGAELARVAVEAEGTAVRRAAVALLAADVTPTLTLPLPDVGNSDAVRELRTRAARDVLTPWLSLDEAALRKALTVAAPLLQVELDRVTQLRPDGAAWRTRWCASWPATPQDDARWLQLCPRDPAPKAASFAP